jgi:predicted short-subunit dehydrogenase-like oxidoreductase (DUF2520 family)
VSGDGRLGHLWIVGAGRAGLSIALRVHRAGAARALTVTGRRADPPDHPLFAGDPPAARFLPDLATAADAPDAVLVAVPDDAIADVAERLAALPLPAGIPVLHTSGSRGSEPLAPLARRGHPVGSAHPLAALADPVDGAERLAGATWGIEATGAALELAERLVEGCDGHGLVVAPGARPIYHAAAVFASNYAVVLLAVAERLMARAGVEPAAARGALAALAAGAVENAARVGPAGALTGPVARGDAATVGEHRARLSGDDRALYCLLGREALRLARESGLDPASAERVSALLEDRS